MKASGNISSRNILYGIACLAFSGMLLTNCKQEVIEIICKDGVIEYEDIDNYSSIEHPISPNKGVTYVIQSEKDYVKYVKTIYKKIDFKRKTLLAGQYTTPSGWPIIKSKRVFGDCGKAELLFQVNISHGLLKNDTPQGISYFAVIPKIPDSTKVKFEVIYTP